MSTPLSVLILEDLEGDAELMIHELERAGYAPQWQRVDTESGYVSLLSLSWDVILADFRLPSFDAIHALKLLHKQSLEIPFILVTGTIGEEYAVSVMQEGAADYVMKDRMARLGQAVRQALEKQSLRNERKRYDEERKLTEERFRATFEQAAVGMAHVLPNGRWLRVNRKLCEILGYDHKQLLSHQLQEILHPADEESTTLVMNQLLSGEKDTTVMESRYLNKNGSWQWVLATISMVRESSGSPAYFIFVIEDITGRKLAEQQIHEQAGLIDLANDAIIVRSLDGEILFWNKRAESLYGWKADEAVGRNINQLLEITGGDRGKALQYLLKHGSWNGEFEQRVKTGKRLVVDARWTLLRDENGMPKSVLVFNSDITEQKKLEQQFLRAQRMESIGTLASGVAHDLNNILAPILMSTSMLREPLSHDLQESIVTTIEESARRGSEIVKQVLTFARGVEGKHFVLQPRHLVLEVEKIMRETFPKSISIADQTPNNLATVNGDPTQLHQVLLNLCINARDAMPNGGKLTISAENKVLDGKDTHTRIPDARPGAYVALGVTDTGTGIPAEIIDKIFDPFFTTKEPGKGTGLGLSTVIGIVKSHGGFVHLESQAGKGSSFKIFLPASNEQASATTGETSELPTGNGEIILVVDDEVDIRLALERLLSRAGYKTILATDGNDALKKFALQAGAVKLVITDVMMPWVDGVVLTRALKKMDPGVRVIASTGQPELSRLEELKALGVKGLLKKPFNKEALLTKVNAVLRDVQFDGDFQA